MYCNTTLTKPPTIAIQISAHCTTILQYNFPANYTKAAIQFPSCNTLSLAIQAILLQYNSLPTRLGHNTISTTQTLLLQYKTKTTTLPRLQYKFSITIQLGSSPNQFSAPLLFFFFVFSFFFHKFFFSIISNCWKNTLKYVYTFFFQYT